MTPLLLLYITIYSNHLQIENQDQRLISSGKIEWDGM